MMRTVFDFQTPTWTKWGVVVFAADAADRDVQIRDITGPDADVTITEERQATAAEVAAHEKYQAWAARWLKAAKTGSAGRHIANP